MFGRKQKQELKYEVKKDFPENIKQMALDLDKKSGDIGSNLYVPLVLFNRKDTINLIRSFKNDVEKLEKVL